LGKKTKKNSSVSMKCEEKGRKGGGKSDNGKDHDIQTCPWGVQRTFVPPQRITIPGKGKTADERTRNDPEERKKRRKTENAQKRVGKRGAQSACGKRGV